MRIIKILLLVLLFPFVIFGQDQAGIDSANANELDIYTRQLESARKQHLADSVQRSMLLAELDKLKNTESEKRSGLVNQLNTIERKDSVQKARLAARVDSLKRTTQGFPVTILQDTIMVIYNRVGSVNALKRADIIKHKVKALAETYTFDSTKLSVNTEAASVDIVYADEVIMSITEMDAVWNNTTQITLAQQYRQQIIQAIYLYKSETNWTSVLKRCGLIVLIVTVLVGIIYFIQRFFKSLRLKIARQKGRYLRELKIKNYRLFDSTQLLKAVFIALNALKWFIIILVLYLTLPLVFLVFPWTENIAHTLLNYVISPLKNILLAVIAYLPNLFKIIIIVVITHYLLKALRFLANEISSGRLEISGFYADWAQPSYNIIRILLYAFMFIVIFPYLPGSESNIFKGVSVFLGVVFSLGSSSAIANMVAGLVITYMRPFRIEDLVKIGEITGEVIEKGFLVTRLRTIKNEEITIPNSAILNGHTIKYSIAAEDGGLILHTTVTIGYDVPWQKVHGLLQQAAANTANLLKEKEPFILHTTLGDFNISYELNVYTARPKEMPVIYSDLHRNIIDEFNKGGVEILSPKFYALRDGNAITIPPEQLPPNYKAPEFGVKVNSSPGRKSTGSKKP